MTELGISEVKFKFSLACPRCLKLFDSNSVRTGDDRIEIACQRCHTVSAEIELAGES